MSLHIRDKAAVRLAAETRNNPPDPASLLEALKACVQVRIDMRPAILVCREENQAAPSVGCTLLVLFDNDVLLPPVTESPRPRSYCSIAERSKELDLFSAGNLHRDEPVMRRKVVGVVWMRAVEHVPLPLAKLGQYGMGLRSLVKENT